MKKFLAILFMGFAFAGNIVPNGINQADLYAWINNANYGINNNQLNSAGIGYEATASVNFKTTITLNYTVNGILYSAAPSAAIGTRTISAIAGTTQTLSVTPIAYYGLYINGAGAYYVTRSQGNYMPGAVIGYTPVGVAKVTLTTGNTAGFKFGTTRFDAASQNVTFYNVRTFSSGPNTISLTGL